MHPFFRWLIALALLGLAAFWFLTRPDSVARAAFDALSGDAERGVLVFHAGGCASCHAAPGAEGEARLVLAGGKSFASPFGTFHAPNISPSQEGLAGWSVADLANAMIHGVSPEGAHYYPAFPYVSYSHVDPQDIADLHAFLMTLPADDTASRAHDVAFPFSVRRGLGLWKLLYANPGWVMQSADTAELERGRYLVEGLGHCAECHTPRDPIGGLDRSAWLAGAPIFGSKGRVPAIRPTDLKWSARDIAYYLETGFTPDYDSAGGEMAEVVENMGHLPAPDRAAIAAYLTSLPTE